MEEIFDRPLVAGFCLMTIKYLELVVVNSVTSTVNFDVNRRSAGTIICTRHSAVRWIDGPKVGLPLID